MYGGGHLRHAIEVVVAARACAQSADSHGSVSLPWLQEGGLPAVRVALRTPTPLSRQISVDSRLPFALHCRRARPTAAGTGGHIYMCMRPMF